MPHADPQDRGRAQRRCDADQERVARLIQSEPDTESHSLSGVPQIAFAFVIFPSECLDHSKGSHHLLNHCQRGVLQILDISGLPP